MGNETDKPTEHLNRYFILRLIAMMVLVLFTEIIVNMAVSKGLIPMINTYINTEIFPTGISSSERILMLLSVLWLVLLRFFDLTLGTLLPKSILLVFGNVAEKYVSFGMAEMDARNLLLIFVTVAGVLLCYLLPCLIGIFIYSRMIVRKVEKIREYDRRQQETFTQRRNLLLSDMAHDLKTPITTVAGYAQALVDHMVDSKEKQEEYLKAIHAKSMQMSHLITLLFDYVKLDSEGFELKKEEKDLSELLRECVAGIYMDAEDKGMALEVVIPEKQCMAQIDPMQFTRAVINLLVNAVKHNPQGTKIRVSLEEQAKNWYIRIADSGSEIEKKLAEHIFDPFVMGDTSRSQKSGSGLGLGISAKIIEMHGGTLALEQQDENRCFNNPEEYTKAFCIEIPRLLTGETYEYTDVADSILLR